MALLYPNVPEKAEVEQDNNTTPFRPFPYKFPDHLSIRNPPSLPLHTKKVQSLYFRKCAMMSCVQIKNICLWLLSLFSSIIKIPTSLRHQILSRQDKGSFEVCRRSLASFFVWPQLNLLSELGRGDSFATVKIIWQAVWRNDMWVKYAKRFKQMVDNITVQNSLSLLEVEKIQKCLEGYRLGLHNIAFQHQYHNVQFCSSHIPKICSNVKSKL